MGKPITAPRPGHGGGPNQDSPGGWNPGTPPLKAPRTAATAAPDRPPGTIPGTLILEYAAPIPAPTGGPQRDRPRPRW